MILRSVVLATLLVSSFAQAQSNQSANQICVDAASNYASRGFDMDVYTWCSDVGSVGEAICREGALMYVTYLPGSMNVKQWCSDTDSVGEGRCRAQQLARKYRTGLPENVKAYCQ